MENLFEGSNDFENQTGFGWQAAKVNTPKIPVQLTLFDVPTVQPVEKERVYTAKRFQNRTIKKKEVVKSLYFDAQYDCEKK